MPWHRLGTVSVTQNSNVVTGVNTAFAANTRVGDAFVGPDGRQYELSNVASDTVISINPPYLGATASGATYAVMPVQGYPKGLVDQVREWVNSYGQKMAALGTTGNYDILPMDKGGTGAVDVAGARAALQVGPRRNLIFNPLFNVNQRRYGGEATTSANQYVYDRWRVVVSGQTAGGQSNKNGFTIVVPAGGIEQVVEGSFISGGDYTLSWSGTTAATINGSAVANGAQVTLTAGANVTIRFSGGYMFYPKLEMGSIATGYEDRSYGEELILCQRYYEKSYPFDAKPGTISGVASPNASNGMTFSCSGTGTRAMGRTKFSVEKRAVPSVRYWDQAGNPSSFSAGNFDGTIQTNGFTGDSFRTVQASSSYIWGHCARNAGDTFFCHWEASAEL